MTVQDNQDGSHWNAENGYNANAKESDVYPHRVFGSGSRDVFRTVLGISVEESDQICSELSPGFRLSLHSPVKKKKKGQSINSIEMQLNICNEIF